MKKEFAIIDAIRNTECCRIATNNGKNALRLFRNGLMSSGFYEIHKFHNVWVLSSTYGSYFTAKEIKKEG